MNTYTSSLCDDNQKIIADIRARRIMKHNDHEPVKQEKRKVGRPKTVEKRIITLKHRKDISSYVGDFERLYNLGYTDPIIAKDVGCSVTSVALWRYDTGRKSIAKSDKSAISVFFANLKKDRQVRYIAIPSHVQSSLGWHDGDKLSCSIVHPGVLQIMASEAKK